MTCWKVLILLKRNTILFWVKCSRVATMSIVNILLKQSWNKISVLFMNVLSFHLYYLLFEEKELMLTLLLWWYQENHYQPVGSEECLPCNCYATGSFDSSCDAVTGQCNCRTGVIGRACDSCPNPYAEVTLRGCEGNLSSCQSLFHFSKHFWELIIFRSF